MRRVAYAAYADLGSPYGGGAESLAIAKGLDEAELLEQGYFRGIVEAAGLARITAVYPSGIGRHLARAVGVSMRLLRRSPRLANESIFDRLLARRLCGRGAPDFILTSGVLPRVRDLVKKRNGKIIFFAKNSLGYADVISAEMSRWGYPADPSELGFAKAADEFLLTTDAVLTLARKDATSLSGFEGGVHRIYNGVNVHKFHPEKSDGHADPKETTFLFLGANPLRKGVFDLLEAWKAADEPGRLIIGGVIAHERVRDFANRRWGGFQRVEFCAHMNALEAYHKADVFVFPTLAEGSPRVVLEAAACGLPIITTDIGSAGVLEHLKTGWIVPERDPASVAGAMVQLGCRAELRAEMGRAARDRAELLPYSSFGSQVAEVVKQVTSGFVG